jgi:hypothetical protein
MAIRVTVGGRIIGVTTAAGMGKDTDTLTT